jgi:putative resolvase
VSSSDQKGALDGQVARLVCFANSSGLALSPTVFEIGSGLKGGRPRLTRLRADPSVSTIVVQHRDRRMRFGSAGGSGAGGAHGSPKQESAVEHLSVG